jgi:hypothetical protein
VWLTTSLRGMLSGTLRADILTEGVHSGSSSGVVPSSFRVCRMLLSRIEDEATGAILVPELHLPPIPPARIAQVFVHVIPCSHTWHFFSLIDRASVRSPACSYFVFPQAAVTASILGDAVFKSFPFVQGAGPASSDLQVRASVKSV